MPRLPVTDPVLLKELHRQGIDPADVDFDQDYAPRSMGKRHSPYAKFYTTFAGPTKGKQFMVVSGLPMVDCDGVKCEPKWIPTGNTYHTKNNVFLALVNDIPGRITLTVKNDDAVGRKKNDKVVLIPQLFLSGVEVVRPGAVLLPVDPLNTHYLENTIEWNYGICKRRLRQIEGRIHGSWVFPANPGGDVRIVYNQTGQYRLKLGQYATDTDTEVIPASVFASATYPFTASDSATYYPNANPETTSVDGEVKHAHASASWNTIVTGAGTGSGDALLSDSGSTWENDDNQDTYRQLIRKIFLFDTGGLPDTATISAAILSLYVLNGGVYDSAEVLPNMNIYSSNPASNTALVAADYNALGSTPYATAIAYNSIVENTYSAFTLNAAGIAAIPLSPAGACAKFGWRNANYDVANSAPTWGSAFIWTYYSEKGNGYKPKLVVTYTAPSTYNLSASDGIKHGDSSTNRNTISITVTDGLKHGDNNGRQVSLQSLASDGFKQGDSSTSQIGFKSLATDGIKHGDTLSSLLNAQSQATDGLVHGDTLATRLNANSLATEGVDIGDSSSPQTIFQSLVTDGVILAELLVCLRAFYQTLTDGFVGGDSTSHSYQSNPVLTDGATWSDALLTQGNLNSTATDGFKHGDSGTTQVIFRSLSIDGIKIGDTPLSQIIINTLSVDGLTLSDLPTTQAVLASLATDGVVLADITSIGFVYQNIVTDGVITGDSTIPQLVMGLGLTEGLTHGDTVTSLLIAQSLIVDAIIIGDTTTNQMIAFLLAAEGIKIGDTSLSKAIFQSLATEGITAGDSTIPKLIAQALATDGLTMSDLLTITFVYGVLPKTGRYGTHTPDAWIGDIPKGGRYGGS